jgi:parvulin-like peptidyl-prolyl isomerase
MTPADTASPAKPSWLDPTRVNPRRAFILMGFGAVLGLVIAGTALFTAKGTSTLIVPDDAVAMVNQQPISRIDFYAQLRALGVEPGAATPAQRHAVLNDMIQEELFVQRGKELDVGAVDPEVRSAVVKAVEAQAAANAITSRPADRELRQYYDARRAKYASEGSVTLLDLVFPASTGAQARAALAAGAPAATVLARFHGKDSGKVKGEEYYFAARIHLGAPIFEAARALGDGEISGPIAASDGSHVLVMQHNARPVPYSYDNARAQVATDYQNEAIARYEKADATFLRKRANVLVAKDMR